MIRLGITGTDTSVGKTVVSAALTAWMRQKKMNVVAMKPIETGGSADDAELLHQVGERSATIEEVCPFRFSDPLAPLVAARRVGRSIEASGLDERFAAISRGRDGVIVEGAGGLLVPISVKLSYATLFQRWNLDLIIVAANRLGVINHTLLTAGAARTAGVPILSIVLNDIPAVSADDVSRESNRATIQELLGEIPIISFPTVPNPRDISSLANAAESSGLGRLVLEKCRR